MTAAAHPSARPPAGALLVDLYELTMAQSYVTEGIHGTRATFSLFARSLPEGWGYLVAAGLDDVLRFLQGLAFGEDDLAFLRRIGLFTEAFLRVLAELRFTGSVRALPEGTVFFPGEPVLEVTGPLLEAQLVETVVLNEIHFQSLAAAKAGRFVDVARGRRLVDFGLRRTHGPDAGMRVARSSYLAGFDATSNVLAGGTLGIPIAGTMAHSYVESFPDELSAFRAYARAYPDGAVLLVDTYDTVEGARRAALVGRELAARGHRLAGVRLDSGDLDALSRAVRAILDDAGLADATIFASGGLGERDVAGLLGGGAPIDGFGIGSKLGTVSDSPFLDMAYKLVEVGGRPVLKLSAHKETLPAAKQVWRRVDGGELAGDVVGLAHEPGPKGAEPLLVTAMAEGGRRLREPLEAIRTRCAAQRALLPAASRGLDARGHVPGTSPALAAERDRATAEARRRQGLP